MILGLSVAAFTATHVFLSLIALASGVFVVRSLFASRTPARITTLFLATTIATSAGGFLFPSARVGLGHVVGALSLVVLLPTVLALYGGHLAGPWRWIYAAGVIGAFYLNAMIAVAQTFIKIPVLRPLAYGLTAPTFLLAQAALAALFIWLGTIAVRRFHPELRSPPRSVLHPV